MTELAQWVFEAMLAVFVAAVGIVGAIFRKISNGDKALHERIEQMGKEYVSKEHLDMQLKHIDRRFDDQREDSHRRHKDLLDRLPDKSS